MESLDLTQILTRARAIIKDDPVDACMGASESGDGWQWRTSTSQCCYKCNGLNHFARDCLVRCRGTTAGIRERRGAGRGVRYGHAIPAGSGNEDGGEMSAPISSLANQ
ncbi:hypothetical protein E2C01_023654 [Portunus trituberculatus]|uniref:CCHC-type domain-containing protein n=1 Tax=Portunus trituberculatus TaxID=210409 RepID=A0A5B7E8K2_PORTR|nr:hypothetical protein [Portunus trituberculatus]